MYQAPARGYENQGREGKALGVPPARRQEGWPEGGSWPYGQKPEGLGDWAPSWSHGEPWTDPGQRSPRERREAFLQPGWSACSMLNWAARAPLPANPGQGGREQGCVCSQETSPAPPDRHPNTGLPSSAGRGAGAGRPRDESQRLHLLANSSFLNPGHGQGQLLLNLKGARLSSCPPCRRQALLTPRPLSEGGHCARRGRQRSRSDQPSPPQRAVRSTEERRGPCPLISYL